MAIFPAPLSDSIAKAGKSFEEAAMASPAKSEASIAKLGLEVHWGMRVSKAVKRC